MLRRMIVYLHGFASGPGSTKARAFDAAFAARSAPLTIPALDEGDFSGMTLSRQLRLLGGICAAPRSPDDPLVLIGSSMGGYLAALYAAQRPVDALVLMAPAVDFAARWRERMGEAEVAAWRERGFVEVDHYALKRRAPISYGLLEDAERHEPWPRVTAPVLVLHGRRDDVVPQERVERFVAGCPDARLLLYDAGHELIECLDDMVLQARRFLSGVPAVAAAYPELGR